jgi:TPR repeat protein
MVDEFGAQKAFLSWEESAEILLIDAGQGIARAQRLLAIRYLRGRGVPKDAAAAFYWMQLAAEQEFSMAQRSLGEFYENGLGIKLDITLASHWYGLAALQGDSIAKEHLQRLAPPNPPLQKSSQSTQKPP